MSYAIICLTALVVSGLTLFSGFGLGTLLMPAFALFFPVEVAVGATALVHLANNLFKVMLVGHKAEPLPKGGDPPQNIGPGTTASPRLNSLSPIS
jgi:uncharacterized membrane protein YfcA